MPTEVAIIVGAIVIVFVTFAGTLAWADWYTSSPTGHRRDVPGRRASVQHPIGNEGLEA